MASLLIRNIGSLYQVRETDTPVLRGKALSGLPVLHNAYLLIENGVIARYGGQKDAPTRVDEVIDARGGSVLPAWCDSHTHLVYAASREGEFVDRIRGLSYEEIARRGGGILNSARRLREMNEEELYFSAWQRLEEVISFGTGAIEIKSGYGLSPESELKMLRVIRTLRENADIPVKATFLGAHAIPKAYQQNRNAYIRLIMDEMLPVIADEQLADYIDVFCDTGFFSVEETDRILEAGAKYGLKPKIHVNELANSGGVQVGIRHHALSVDHCERIGKDEVGLLGKSNTIATLLPSCAFFLNIPYAPARRLIDSGAAVALATDYNPGSTPSGKMPFVISLACIKLGMLPEEAVNAATINGAHAMEVADQLGTIQTGKTAHLIVTKKMPSLAFLPYAFGSDLIRFVILKNRVVRS